MPEFKEPKNESENAESHLRVAEELFIKAKTMLEIKKTIPHPNPNFRDSKAQAKDFAGEALNSLHYAMQFGLKTEEVLNLEKEIEEFLKKLIL